MKCPLCETPTIFDKRLESGLKAKRCSKCEGLWVSFLEYREWLDSGFSEQPPSGNAEIDLEVNDTKKVKVCLDCGRILMKFRVGHGIGFRLDHCNFCNGIWFDKNEWESIVDSGLENQLVNISSKEWQHNLRREEVSQRLEQHYKEQFGSDYAEIKRFKTLIENHEQRSMILAYINDSDEE